MRVAALYDIHGNLPALEAALAEVRREHVDLVVVGGDVMPGPMPRESLSALGGLSVPTRWIHGNGERDVLAFSRGEIPSRVPERVQGVMRWTAKTLSADQLAEIARWPMSWATDVPGLGRVLFCHATPRDENELFTCLTPEEHLRPAFEVDGVDVVICGHTHMPFDRRIGRVRVLNAGSVGMPFGVAGADWLLLDRSGVRFRHTGYDLISAAARIRATAYPQAAEFAANHVLEPPSAERMLEVFTRCSAGLQACPAPRRPEARRPAADRR